MTEAQFSFYLLPVSCPVSLPEVDVGSVPDRRRGGSCLKSDKNGQMVRARVCLPFGRGDERG